MLRAPMNVALPAREHGYEIFDAIASGGMAVVHLGRRRGAAGFARVVAVKRLHPHLAGDPDLVAMLVDEAQLSARVRHANVVSVLDVIEDDGLALVMEYVHGASLSELTREAARRGERVPRDITSAIVIGALSGLHAAHEAHGEDGEPLGLVHRDVSPQNILVGTDGTARIVDFGIAKARVRSHVTREGTLKGKLAYMAPEQLAGSATRRTDVLAAGVVLWELFAGKRFYDGVEDEAQMIGALSMRAAPPLAPHAPDLAGAAVHIVERALRKDPDERFATAGEMAHALQEAVPPAPPRVVGAWVERIVGAKLSRRAALIARIERGEPLAIEAAPSTRKRAPDAPAQRAAEGEGEGQGAGTRVDRLARTAPQQLLGGVASGDPPVAGRDETVTIDPAVRRVEASRRPSRRARWVAGGLGLLGFTAAVLVGATARNGASPATLAPMNTPPDDTPPATSAEAATAPSLTATADSAPPTPPSNVPSTAERLPPPSPRGVVAGASGPHGPAATPRGGSSAALSVPGCDPPWELDEQGIKRVKRACLR